jgi:hypothetical protein
LYQAKRKSSGIANYYCIGSGAGYGKDYGYGDSLLNYDRAEVVQKKNKGNEMEIDLKVPLGDTNSYEFVHISFQKTENGWRIFSEPGSL